MTTWTVRAVNAHDGTHAWTKEYISAENSDQALSEFLNSFMPNRPLTLLVWITDESNNESLQVTIGLH